MSEEDVETVRRAYEAWSADNLDAFLAELDPEGEWHPSIEPALEGGETVYRGHDGVRKAWKAAVLARPAVPDRYRLLLPMNPECPRSGTAPRLAYLGANSAFDVDVDNR